MADYALAFRNGAYAVSSTVNMFNAGAVTRPAWLNVWLRPDVAPGASRSLVGFTNGSRWFLYITSSTIRVYWAGSQWDIGQTLTQSVWNHLLFVEVSSTERYFYLNGTKYSDTTSWGSTPTGLTKAYVFDSGAGWDCDADDFAARHNVAGFDEAAADAMAADIWSGGPPTGKAVAPYLPTHHWLMDNRFGGIPDHGTTAAPVIMMVEDGGDPDDVDYTDTPMSPPSDLVVLGNSIELTHGDVTPATADHTDFGATNVTGGTVTRTFYVRNDGGADIAQAVAAVSGDDAGDFTVLSQPTTPLAAEGLTSFQVRADPSARGVRTTTVQIDHDDAAKADPFTFKVQVTGQSSLIVVKGNSQTISDADTTPDPADHTDFGDVLAGLATVTRTFTIQNTGELSLNITDVALSGTGTSAYSIVSQPDATVAAGQTTTFDVTFDPTGAGDFDATVTISSDGLGNESYTFDLTGTATAPVISVTGDVLSFEHEVGETSDTVTLTVTNTGSANLALEVDGGLSWVIPSVQATVVAPAGSVQIQFRAITVGLPLGTHASTVTLSDANGATTDKTRVMELVLKERVRPSKTAGAQVRIEEGTPVLPLKEN